jgi:hypothetical protein
MEASLALLLLTPDDPCRALSDPPARWRRRSAAASSTSCATSPTRSPSTPPTRAPTRPPRRRTAPRPTWSASASCAWVRRGGAGSAQLVHNARCPHSQRSAAECPVVHASRLPPRPLAPCRRLQRTSALWRWTSTTSRSSRCAVRGGLRGSHAPLHPPHRPRCAAHPSRTTALEEALGLPHLPFAFAFALAHRPRCAAQSLKIPSPGAPSQLLLCLTPARLLPPRSPRCRCGWRTRRASCCSTWTKPPTRCAAVTAVTASQRPAFPHRCTAACSPCAAGPLLCGPRPFIHPGS